jgi:hypothetical protein
MAFVQAAGIVLQSTSKQHVLARITRNACVGTPPHFFQKHLIASVSACHLHFAAPIPTADKGAIIHKPQ